MIYAYLSSSETTDLLYALESPSFEESPMHDVDVVQRILEYFLMHEQQQQNPEKFDVGKLIDGYISEVARDPALSISKFQALAEALPQNARACHDGLYRAIDTYLKVIFLVLALWPVFFFLNMGFIQSSFK